MANRVRCEQCQRLIDRRGIRQHLAAHNGGYKQGTKFDTSVPVKTVAAKLRKGGNGGNGHFTRRTEVTSLDVVTFANIDDKIIEICQAFFPSDPLLWTVLNRLLQAGAMGAGDRGEIETMVMFAKRYLEAWLGDVGMETSPVPRAVARRVELTTPDSEDVSIVPINSLDLPSGSPV